MGYIIQADYVFNSFDDRDLHTIPLYARIRVKGQDYYLAREVKQK